MSPERWQRIEQLYHEAQECPAPARAAWLAQACAGDEALRDEVEKLLTADESASGFMDAPAWQAEARKLAAEIPVESLVDSFVGQQFSHYKILSKLGAGGMGEVYLAHDLALERRVAIKVLPGAFTRDAERVQRFVREAKAASALNHPNIITIHEIGQAPLAGGATQYIVTELVEGETLRQRLRSGPLPRALALDLTAQVAAALAAAHKAGIIHRDIKPENVMVRPDGLVKVLDFGLAKLTEKSPFARAEVDSEAPTMQQAISTPTTPGTVMGTLNYMSPEQVRGESVDARSDLFSVGIVLYELLTGAAPFTRKTQADIIAAILEHTPPSLVQKLPDAPPELAELASQLLRKDKDERWSSAATLADELKRLKLSDEAGAISSSSAARATLAAYDEQAARATQVGFAQVTGTLARKRPRRAILVALWLSLAAALGYFIYVRYAAEGEIDSIAILPLVNAEGKPESDYLADGLTEGLINNLSQVPNLKVMSRNAVFRYKNKNVDAEEIKQRFKVRAMLTGRLLRQGDQYVVKLELIDTSDNHQLWSLDKSYQLTALQSQIAQDVAVKLRARLTEDEKQQISKPLTEDTEAYQHYLRGRHHWNTYTEAGLKSGIAEFELALRRDPKFAAAEAGLALCYIGLATNYGAPEANLRLAKQHALEAVRLDDKLDEAHYALGRVYMFYDWDWRRAGDEFQRTLELNPNHALTYQAYSVLAQTLSNLSDDLKYSQKALEYDPVSLPLNLSLCLSYYFAEQYEQALAQAQVCSVLEPNSYFPPFYLARIYVEQGKYQEAIQQLQIAASRADGRGAMVRATLGYAYARAGQPNEARKIATELSQGLATTYVPPTYLAMIYAALNDADEAFRWLEQAAQEHSPWLLKLNVEPAFKRLRTDHRFTALLKRMGLDVLKSTMRQPPEARPLERRGDESQLARHKLWHYRN